MRTLLDIADIADKDGAAESMDLRAARISSTIARLRNATVHLLDVKMMIGSGYDEPKPYEIRDGIAIVDVSGPLMAESYWYQDYDDVLEAVKAAGEDSSVAGILLRINSPGGETDRAFETAAEIEAIGKKKPIWCVADVNAYSAGYLLACCAEKIYAAPISGGVGSIGVYCAHWDYSEYLKQAGIKVTLIGDPEGKTSGNPFEPLDEEGKKELRGEIERLSGEFFSFVARRRKMTVEEVQALNAGLFHGAARALGAKLADQAGTFETALSEMIASMRERSLSVAARAAITQQENHMENDAKPAVEQPKAAVESPVKAEPETDVKVVAEMPKPAAADLETVLTLCAVAGLTAIEAVDIHKKGFSVEQLRADLTNRRAAKDEAAPTSGLTGAPIKATGMGTIEARAEALRVDEPKLSREQAMAQVLRANPALYQQYLSENPAQTSGR